MATGKTNTSRKTVKGEPVRQRVLDAAERLLRRGKAEFSMRDLATEAYVSFATPFNHFGSKAAIMHALLGRLNDVMLERYTARPVSSDILERVRMAVDTAVTVALEEPQVNRSVMSWIGIACPTPQNGLDRAMALWKIAVGDYQGRLLGSSDALVRHLTFAFRGIISCWTAGEITDDALQANSQEIVTGLLGRMQ